MNWNDWRWHLLWIGTLHPNLPSYGHLIVFLTFHISRPEFEQVFLSPPPTVFNILSEKRCCRPYPVWPVRPALSTAQSQREPARGGSPSWTPSEHRADPQMGRRGRRRSPPTGARREAPPGGSGPNRPRDAGRAAEGEAKAQPSCSHAGTTGERQRTGGSERRRAGQQLVYFHQNCWSHADANVHRNPWVGSDVRSNGSERRCCCCCVQTLSVLFLSHQRSLKCVLCSLSLLISSYKWFREQRRSLPKEAKTQTLEFPQTGMVTSYVERIILFYFILLF